MGLVIKSFRTCLRSFMRHEQHTLSSKCPLHLACSLLATSNDNSTNTFDVRLLDVLACPLSKKPLSPAYSKALLMVDKSEMILVVSSPAHIEYDAEAKELICDDLGVAYPIVNGIPNLNPQDGRMIKKSSGSTEQKE